MISDKGGIEAGCWLLVDLWRRTRTSSSVVNRFRSEEEVLDYPRQATREGATIRLTYDETDHEGTRVQALGSSRRHRDRGS